MPPFLALNPTPRHSSLLTFCSRSTACRVAHTMLNHGCVHPCTCLHDQGGRVGHGAGVGPGARGASQDGGLPPSVLRSLPVIVYEASTSEHTHRTLGLAQCNMHSCQHLPKLVLSNAACTVSLGYGPVSCCGASTRNAHHFVTTCLLTQPPCVRRRGEGASSGRRGMGRGARRIQRRVGGIARVGMLQCAVNKGPRAEMMLGICSHAKSRISNL